MTVSEGWASWASATLDVVPAWIGVAIVAYPLVAVGNAVLGAPLADGTVHLVVGVVALGGAYPVVAGPWSLGGLGAFTLALVGAALAWGVLGLVAILAAGLSIPGSNRLPQAAVWAAAYLTATVLVTRTSFSLGD